MTAVLRHQDRGDQILCTVTLADLDGNPPSPDTVLFSVMDPRGPATQTDYTDASPEVTNVQAGTWQLLFTADRVGDWLVRAEGTGNVKQVARGVVTVDRDPFSS